MRPGHGYDKYEGVAYAATVLCVVAAFLITWLKGVPTPWLHNALVIAGVLFLTWAVSEIQHRRRKRKLILKA